MDATEAATASFNLLEWVKVFLGFAGPIMVVWVSSKMEKSRKSDEAQRATESEERMRKDQEVRNAFTELERKIDRIDKDLASVKGTVENMQRLDEGVRSDLAVLAKYHEYNVKHLQKLSGVVMTVSEGVRDRHVDGNLTAAVDSLKQFERQMYSELLSNAPLTTADLDKHGS